MMRLAKSPPPASWVVSAALLAVVGLAGCQEHHADPAMPPPAGQADLLPPGHYPQNVAAEGLDPWLRFGEPVVDESTSDRPMFINQPVRNVWDGPVTVQYRYDFFDRAHHPLGPDGGWKTLTLEPRLEAMLQGGSLSTDAVDWHLTVRPAR